MNKFIFYFFVAALSIASCAKKTVPTVEGPPVVIDGAHLFSKNCARCHGAEGIKDSRTPNLQTITLGKDGLIKSITYGKNNMPAFEDKLSVAEIAAIADLIAGWHNH